MNKNGDRMAHSKILNDNFFLFTMVAHLGHACITAMYYIHVFCYPKQEKTILFVYASENISVIVYLSKIKRVTLFLQVKN